MVDVVGQETLEIMSGAGFYNKWITDLIEPSIEGDVVEIGAGVGEFVKRLVSKHPNVSALDVNEEYLRKIKKDSPGVNTYLFDLQSTATSSQLINHFDTVVAINVLEHLPNLQLALKHIHAMLKNDGKVVILIPAFQFAFGNLDKNLGHYRRFTKNSLTQHLTINGFKVKSSRYVNFWGLWGWWVNGRLLKKKIIPKNQVKIFDLFFRPWMMIEKYIAPPMGLSVVCIAEKK